jgi:serine protease Do
MEEGSDPRKVLPKVEEKLRALGFEVIAPKAGEPISSQGSGFIIDEKGHVLTCAHVLSGKTNATVWNGTNRFSAIVVNVDTNCDMALLRLENPTRSFTPLTFSAETNLSMGQDVFTMGFPLSDVLGSAPRLTKGLLSSTVGMGDNPNFVQISAEVQSGNSGGPLLNGRSEVVGLVTSTLNPINVLARTGTTLPQNVNFAAKPDVMRNFLTQSGIAPKTAATNEPAGSFDQVKNSLALVRAGYVSAEGATVKEAVCVVNYIYFWDMWYRFRAFQLDFNDLKNGERILRAGQYGDKVFTGEDAVIDSVIAEVGRNFFPNQTPPTGTQKKAPASTRR